MAGRWPAPSLVAGIVITALAAALTLLPISALVGLALDGGIGTVSRLAGSVLPSALADTLVLLLGVAVLGGAIGIGTAWLVTATAFPGSRILAWLLPLPLAVPTYVLAFIFVELFDTSGPVQAAFRALGGFPTGSGFGLVEIRSLPGCVLVLSLALYPYVFVPARAAFLARSRAACDAARTLGGRGVAVFWHVGLPMARPAIAVGIALALLETLNDVGATEFLGVRTLTLAAYTAWLNGGDLPAAAQLAAVALMAVAVLLAIEWHYRGERRRASGGVDAHSAQATRLEGGRAALACLACVAPVLLGLFLPVAFLAHEVLGRGLLLALPPGFGRHLATTLGLGLGATGLAVGVAVPLVLTTRWMRNRAVPGLAAAAGLGYAIPGTFVVLGLFGAAQGLDAFIGALGRPGYSGSAGLLLTGTVAGLLVAYLIRFLRVAATPLAAQLEAAGPALEAAGRTLGAGPLAVARHVQLPLLRPALGAAMLLVFVDCVKELPATLLLRPLNVETMATLIYGASARGSFEDGALAALVIVAACLPPVLWLTAFGAPRRAEAGQAALRDPVASATR